jgi:hypothetical protein
METCQLHCTQHVDRCKDSESLKWHTLAAYIRPRRIEQVERSVLTCEPLRCFTPLIPRGCERRRRTDHESGFWSIMLPQRKRSWFYSRSSWPESRLMPTYFRGFLSLSVQVQRLRCYNVDVSSLHYFWKCQYFVLLRQTPLKKLASVEMTVYMKTVWYHRNRIRISSNSWPEKQMTS